LLTLADGTLMYPAHVAGSLCGRMTSKMTMTTIGFERAQSPALAIEDEAEFVRYTTASLPERPPNMARIVELNKAADAGVIAPASLHKLTSEEVRRLSANGAIVLDVRSPAQFAAGHLPGAISVQIEGAQFPNRAGLTLPAESELVLVAQDEPEARAAATALAVIGHGRVLGILAGGTAGWAQAGYTLATLPRLTVPELRRALDGANAPLVLDVREPSEWSEGHIAGSINIPFYQVAARSATLERTRPIAIVCATGHRSAIAASVLQARGFEGVRNVVGGMAAWQASEPAAPVSLLGRG
jgi:hydroxyacylglutathione hydrolase